jgi:hypothetical protein
MGLFDKKIKGAQDAAADAMAQAQAAQAGAPGMPAGMDMGAMTGGQDMAAMAAYSQKVNKIAQVGIEAPGVVHTLTANGTPDISGGTMYAVAVTYRPEGADPIETTVDQSFLPFQLETLSEGSAITVKYDPDDPTSAVIHGW